MASMVVIAEVPTLSMVVMQERVGFPSTWMVQAPHSAAPQPNLVPVIPRTSRRTHRTGVSPSTSTVRTTPFTLMLYGMSCLAVRLAQGEAFGASTVPESLRFLVRDVARCATPRMLPGCAGRHHFLQQRRRHGGHEARRDGKLGVRRGLNLRLPVGEQPRLPQRSRGAGVGNIDWTGRGTHRPRP